MDLWRLMIFRKVVDHKSFSKAARVINLSQPTVSTHIKDLETHYGCKMLDRVDRQAVPTKAGELLYGYAERLAALAEELETAMADFHGAVRGKLVIGGSTIPGDYLLPRFIGAFRKRYPDVSISLRVGDTEKILIDIQAGMLEIGVVGAAVGSTNIVQTILMEEEMRLIVPGDHKWARKKSVSLKDLSREPFIVRETGSGTLMSLRKSLSESGLAGGDLNIVAELGSTGAIVQGIKNNLGISILSPIAVDDDVRSGRLAALAVRGLTLKRAFYLSRHKNRSLSPLGETFYAFLKEQGQPDLALYPGK